VRTVSHAVKFFRVTNTNRLFVSESNKDNISQRLFSSVLRLSLTSGTASVGSSAGVYSIQTKVDVKNGTALKQTMQFYVLNNIVV